MKKIYSLTIALSFAMVPNASTAAEFSTNSTPSHDKGHSLSIEDSRIIGNPGIWTPETTEVVNETPLPTFELRACAEQVTAPGTIRPNNELYNLGGALLQCGILYKSGTFLAAEDLSDAEIAAWPNYESQSYSQGDPRVHIVLVSLFWDENMSMPWIIWTDSVEYDFAPSNPEPSTELPFSAPAPFQGPLINTPSIPPSNAPGSTITIPGENLDDVSAVSIGNTDAEVEVIDEQLQVVLPESLEAGTYDLIISSSTGNVTISDAITISASAVNASEAPRGSTSRIDDAVKIRVFNPAGAGKVQIMVNGEEIAWVRTDDPNDPKLTNGYLVRTVKLEPGKNVIEILVDGERIRRNAYGL